MIHLMFKRLTTLCTSVPATNLLFRVLESHHRSSLCWILGVLESYQLSSVLESHHDIHTTFKCVGITPRSEHTRNTSSTIDLSNGKNTTCGSQQVIYQPHTQTTFIDNETMHQSHLQVGCQCISRN